MEMTELLAKHRFEYALVQEASLQDALGRTTPVSGCYTDWKAFLLMILKRKFRTKQKRI